MPSSFPQVLMRPSLFAIALVAALLFSGALWAEENDAAAKAEMEYELDPYYTNISYNIPLTNRPIPVINSGNEAVILHELLRDSLVPRFMLVEASVYPMPVLGTYLKSHQSGFYNSANIGSDMNAIESLTAGFQEPCAVSLFFGNVARLKRPGDQSKTNNYGYTGYLLSVGTKHIKDNILIDDDWAEFEWKVKGKIDRPGEKLSWSFRIGGKFNRNPEVNDVTYLKLTRSNTDLKASYLAWLENTNLDFSLHFLQHTGKLVRSELIAGKKMPLLGYKLIPTFSAGFIWTHPDEYSGALHQNTNTKMLFVLRPSVEF